MATVCWTVALNNDKASAMIPIFDGHNDVLLRLSLKASPDPAGDFVAGDGQGHIDLPRLKAGGFCGGLFAMFVPSGGETLPDDDDPNPPLAQKVKREQAFEVAASQARLFHAMVERSARQASHCTTRAEIDDALARGSVAMVLHLEGAEAIGSDLQGLEELYAMGLRSIGPVWSRPNHFGHGVPFRFPSSPDTGPGLTEAGRDLVRACNARRILVDLSHINEKGFWDVAKISAAPLVATHSNAHALCASSRNLTDAQIKAIGESGGLIGLNYAVGFLREDGHWNKNTEADVLIRHLDYLVRHAGEDCVGLGSDFDGARIPNFIGDAAGVPRLVEAIEKAGFGAELIEKIAYKNWLRVLAATIG
jgi:membrane dipeptidase